MSVARNQGVAEAKSDFISFLDADDGWLPEFLETIFALRDKYPNAVLYGTGRIVVISDEQTPVLCNPESGDRLLEGYIPEGKEHFCRDGNFSLLLCSEQKGIFNLLIVGQRICAERKMMIYSHD